ncbi:MAG TPA: M13 family metallopeptidase, partial [Gemmatimonadales bacterium]|nr:M13 family metallopeptidase [Gemmatimonadales bacterium]
GDDFFAYANDAWLSRTALPAGRARFGAREEITALTRTQLDAIYAAGATAPTGSVGRKVADFRAAYLDRSTIDAKGLEPLRPYFAEVDAIGDVAALTRALGRGMRADVDPLNYAIYRSAHILGLSVEPGINGERTYVAFLVQGGLGLPDREDYLDADPAKEALRARYRVYVEHLFTLAGFDRAGDRADRVVALEHAIALTQATQAASARDHNADTLWTRADFARRAPGMDWGLFFAAAGLARQESFVPWQPSAVTGVAALVASEPLEGWKDYLRFHALHDHLDLLPRSFGAQALLLQGAAADGGDADSLRAERAQAATDLALGEAIGRLYAERNFTPGEKARVLRIVENVRAQFLRRVEAATWMTPATKAAAIAMVKGLYIGIGYPERWQDYADLGVDRRDAYGNVVRAEERNYRRAVAKLGRPVDRTEWW